MIHRYVLMLTVGSLLTACATSTSIVPAGKDTYLVAGSDSWETVSGSKIKTSLYQKATLYCQGMGKMLQPLDESVFSHSAELRFRCLSEDDPEYIRPKMENVPNVRIETN